MATKQQHVEEFQVSTEGPAIPPLSQSKHADMACGLLFVAKHIEGLNTTSQAAERGREIHEVIAEYMEALRVERRPTDYEKFKQIAAGVGEEAAKVLDPFGESWTVDTEKIYDTELHIFLDKDFKLLEARRDRRRTNKPVEGAVYEGTIDLVLMESEAEATIHDWKSFFQIVNADSFQSKLYPLLLMKFNPAIDKVRFVLSFVRYGSAQRDVTYTREDLPKLETLVKRERTRQERLYERASEGRTETASPGRHCTWCPKLLNSCPMAKVNPYAQIEPGARVGLALWMAAAKRENDSILKQVINQDGPVPYRDDNGTSYSAAFVAVEKKFYPAPAAIAILTAWDAQNNDDVLAKATLSGLSSKLKAKKRLNLSVSMSDVANVRTETKMKILGVDDEDDEE